MEARKSLQESEHLFPDLIAMIPDFVVGADAGGRIEARKSLRDSSEQLFTTLIAMIPDFVVRTNAGGRIEFINETALKMSGYDRAEIIGKEFFHFVAPEDRQRAIENTRFIFERRLGPKEFRLVMKNGEKIPFEVSGEVLRRQDGSPYAIVYVCRDISEHRKAEESLRRQNSYLEAFHETTLDLMRRMDLTELFQAIVVRATHLFGAEEGWICVYNPQTGDFEFKAAIGRMAGMVGSRFETSRGIAGELWRTGGTVYIDDYNSWSGRAQISSYDLRHSTVAVPLKFEGHIAGILGLAHYQVGRRFEKDELVMLERLAELASIALENARIYDQMKRNFEERRRLESERKLIQAQFLESQKMEAIGTLAGGIAHDFNNILAGIQGHISLLQMDLPPNHPHHARLQKIEEQVGSGASLTRQLLGFGRGGKYEVKATNLNDVIGKSSETFGRTHKELSVYREFEKGLWSVEADRGQIEQVLLNLYINAWHAMPEGGDLSLATQNVALGEMEVKPRGLPPGRYVKISVTDTGTGMDEKTRSRIFEPFFTTKGPGKGTGLGLASAYGIIENHGGFITVESERGKGARFDIYLPASDNKMAEETIAEKKILMGQETILVVDDEKCNLTVTKEILESLGYRVMVAGCGQEAIALYMEKGREIDLVVLDLIMPGMGGGKAFETLRNINPHLKVILSSGYSIDGEARRILENGCNGFIQKPFRMADISQKVREVLGD
jgi:PAS domain S-box-containing protein